jgi:HD-like signal output (HDOD) protein
MEIGKNVPGADGSVFLSKGTVLSADQIQDLLDLGVNAVSIVSKGKEEEQKDLARRCEEYVRPFFDYVDPSSPFFNALYRESLKSTMNRIIKEKRWALPCAQELRAIKHQSRRDLFFVGEGGPEEIVDHEMELISFPDTYFKLREILNTPNSTAEHVAEVVRLDVNLSAKLLRLVNSPVYAFNRKVESIERAVALIGIDGVSNLALGITAIAFFEDIPPDLLDVPTFWRHSLSCAIFSKLLAQAAGLEEEQFFTSGLLHDVGRLLLLKKLPYASLQFLLYARGNLVPLVEAERVVLGYDHAQVGEKLLQAWECPQGLVLPVGGHHAPMQSSKPKESAIIQLADNLANAYAIAKGGTYVLPGMEQEVLQMLGLDNKKILSIFNAHEESLQEVAKLLL